MQNFNAPFLIILVGCRNKSYFKLLFMHKDNKFKFLAIKTNYFDVKTFYEIFF